VNFATKAIERITSVLAAIAAIAVALMMVHITISIITRSGFDHALTGVITIVSNYYMVIVVCLPLAFVERKDAHITVDVLTNHLPERARVRLFGWTYLLSALVFGLVAFASWGEAVTKYGMNLVSVENDIAIPTWIGYFAVPFGYGMGALYALLLFVRFLIGTPPPAAANDFESQVEKLAHE
jgi:TRAP-type C4-dicarboxylate transport system permease small subunit